MSERAAILARVARASTRASAHPGPYAPAAASALKAHGEAPASRNSQSARWDTFGAALATAGGAGRGPVPRAALATAVRAEIARWGASGRRVVAEPEAAALLGDGPWQRAEAAAAPHDFADVAVAIVPGSVAVAENGAVAVERARAPQRALHFLCERLVLLVAIEDVVGDLHDAFARLAARGASPENVVWIAGPSKTADIEQALVYGAHGPLALTAIGWE